MLLFYVACAVALLFAAAFGATAESGREIGVALFFGGIVVAALGVGIVRGRSVAWRSALSAARQSGKSWWLIPCGLAVALAGATVLNAVVDTTTLEKLMSVSFVVLAFFWAAERLANSSESEAK